MFSSFTLLRAPPSCRRKNRLAFCGNYVRQRGLSDRVASGVAASHGSRARSSDVNQDHCPDLHCGIARADTNCSCASLRLRLEPPVSGSTSEYGGRKLRLYSCVAGQSATRKCPGDARQDAWEHSLHWRLARDVVFVLIIPTSATGPPRSPWLRPSSSSSRRFSNAPRPLGGPRHVVDNPPCCLARVACAQVVYVISCNATPALFEDSM